MALNYDLFRTVVAPEFAAKADNELDPFASEAEIEVSQKAFGKRYDRAVALITAHLIVMSQKKSGNGGGAGATGEVESTKVGQLSRKFNVESSMTERGGSYNLTHYGKEFLRLRKQILKSPIFV